MINSKQFILNLGAGCVDTARYERGWFTVHVDGCYRIGLAKTAEDIELEHSRAIDWASKTPEQVGPNPTYPKQLLCSSDIFDFVERYPLKFDYIYAERIFEHMEYVGGEIGRLLEGINRISTDDAILEIVVPNMVLIADMIKNYEVANLNQIESMNHKLIINSECNNVRCDPHLSTWTPLMAKEYINSEGTWQIDNIVPQINFAGRDIYMRITCKK